MDRITFPFCAKILPLTYDDSLSYYEQVCKLANKMNEIINIVNGSINDNIQKYIDEKFDQLMINAVYDGTNEMIILQKEEK